MSKIVGQSEVQHLNLPRKFLGSCGTPWSGQAVKCKWQMILLCFEVLCFKDSLRTLYDDEFRTDTVSTSNKSNVFLLPYKSSGQ